jgi:hypothetical protein
MKNVNIFLVIVTVVFLSVATGCGKNNNPTACADCTQAANTPVVHNNATATPTNNVVVNATATVTQTSTSVVTTATATFTSTNVVSQPSPTATVTPIIRAYYVTVASTNNTASSIMVYVGAGNVQGNYTDSPYSISSAYGYIWTSDTVYLNSSEEFHTEGYCTVQNVIVTVYENGVPVWGGNISAGTDGFAFNND